MKWFISGVVSAVAIGVVGYAIGSQVRTTRRNLNRRHLRAQSKRSALDHLPLELYAELGVSVPVAVTH